MKWRSWLILIFCACWSEAVLAGMKVEIVEDPRIFEQQQKVIFPNAEIKLIILEFESETGDEAGKQLANELHDHFLTNISDLRGGAVVTYVTKSGAKIENYRIKAEEIAKKQKAQMILWGRVIPNSKGRPFISARLTLIAPPPGISAEYSATVLPNRNMGAAFEVKGVIDAPVTQQRIDFNALESDVAPIALFLSGMARYYKGAVREGAEAKRWLTGSIKNFMDFVNLVPENTDASALSQAHLYLARAYVRLAVADPSGAKQHLESSRVHASKAAGLNPYDPSVPSVQAIVASRQRSDLAAIRSHLDKAAQLAPTDSNTRLNLAVVDSADGKIPEANRQLDFTKFLARTTKQISAGADQAVDQNEKSLRAAETLQNALEVYQTPDTAKPARLIKP